MKQILDDISDLDVFLALEPEELGERILFELKRPQRGQVDPRFDPGTWINDFVILAKSRDTWMPHGNPYLTRGVEKQVIRACEEAFNWLETHGMLSISYEGSPLKDRRQITRKSERIGTRNEFQQYVTARHLPKQLLHPRISQTVWMAFMRGEYDGAVFQAMKAVEVAVREASGLPDKLVGVKLMRAAFAPPPKAGPLADLVSEEGEQVARMELFAGAIGSFKNPHSHRDVNLDDAAEATEVILLANHLLRIVDSRRQARV